jgi:hypothetical protein
MLYESFFAAHPVVPRHLLGNRTSLSGCVMTAFYIYSRCVLNFSPLPSYAVTFLHGLVVTLVIYYLPTYFQGAKGASAIRSGVLLFATACIIGVLLFPRCHQHEGLKCTSLLPFFSSVCHHHRSNRRTYRSLPHSELYWLGAGDDWLRHTLSANCFFVHCDGRRVADNRCHGIWHTLCRP